MVSLRVLRRLSISRLQRLIDQKRAQSKVVPLEAQRAKLLRRVKKLDKKIARLGGDVAKTGRKGKASRKRKRKFSAAGRRALIAGIKRRWAAWRKAKKAAAGQAAS